MFTDGAPSFSSEGDRVTYRYQGTLQINSQNRLAFGVEREDNESNGEESSIDGIFALYELQPVDTLTLSAGVRRDDHEEYGGAPLLGINGICIIAHGSSSPRAIRNAIRVATQMIRHEFNAYIKDTIATIDWEPKTESEAPE